VSDSSPNLGVPTTRAKIANAMARLLGAVLIAVVAIQASNNIRGVLTR